MISEKLLNKILIYFILFLMILSSLMFFIFFTKEENLKNLSYLKQDKKKDISLNIVSKALFLESFKFDVSIDALKDEIEISIIEKRPDSNLKKEKFEVKFKKNPKVLKLQEDEKFYVAVDKNGNFVFSDTKTPLVIFFKAIDKKNVKVIIETDLMDFIKDQKNKTDFFILTPNDFIFTQDIEKKEELKLLASSKWFSKDELLQFYDKKSHLKDSQRLEINGKIIHLNVQDILIFKDGFWQKIDTLENTQNYTIAKIKSIDNKILEMEAWDENGNKYIFALPSMPKQGFSIRTDQFISSVRKRTLTHLSCQIEKQRVILKEKDILIKKEGRWRILKKDIDLDEIRNEELFYFDKIENKNNKNFFIGYLFNPMRTSYQKIETPIMSIASQKKRAIR